MQKKDLLFCFFSFCATSNILAQQRADTLFNPPVPNPVYAKGEGSIVFIDAAHNNFHTPDGRFKPFANTLSKDGYRIKANTEAFTKEKLALGKILVIANAIHESNLTRWTLPTPSAF
jgi:hypothetical protein